MREFWKFHKYTVLIFLLSVLSFRQLDAEYSISILGGQNGGEFVFETGNRFPNLSGITGGSRISFERDFPFFGLAGKYWKSNWEISGKFTTTGWYVPTGRARDEDFFLFSVSQERAHPMAFRELSFTDSATVFSGTRNFADGVGKSSMSEYNFEFLGRYYFGEARSDIYQSGDGFFLSGGARYTYNKYYFYDVIQWVAFNPPFIGPIGYGLSFTNTILEVPIGFGYRWNWESFYLDTSFHLLFSYLQTRDFHAQRNINFNSTTLGPGILASVETGYKLDESKSIFFRLIQHRFFTKGSFEAVGGLSEGDIAANFLGRYKAFINTKQFSIEFGLELRPNWGGVKDAEAKPGISTGN
jgi:outer membrane protease